MIDMMVLCGILKYLEHLEFQRGLYLRSKSYVDRHDGQMNVSYLKNMEPTGAQIIHGMGSRGLNFTLRCIISLLLPIQRFSKLDLENENFSAILILRTHIILSEFGFWTSLIRMDKFRVFLFTPSLHTRVSSRERRLYEIKREVKF
jgi:hypothetical protein